MAVRGRSRGLRLTLPSHAAVNFTASKKSYDDCPAMVRPGEGIIMVVGIPRQPLEFNGLDIALGRYRVKGSNNGSESCQQCFGRRLLTLRSLLQHEARY